MAQNVGVYVAAGAGTILAYSALTGRGILPVGRGLIHGQAPNQVSPDQAIVPGAGGGGSTPGGGGAVSSIATASIGHCYVFGGIPGRDFKGCWDCSSAMNSWWKQAGRAVPFDPRNTWNGSTHGPVAAAWLLWPKLRQIHVSEVQADDLLIWQTHIGVAVSPTEMVSALNPSKGTLKTGFDVGPLGEVMFAKRFTG